MSIGPRLPRQDAENCSCGGVYVFVRNANIEGEEFSIWKCGSCDSARRGPYVGERATQQPITSAEFTE